MQDDFCKDGASGVKITGYVNVTSGDENALKSAVAMLPVTVAINTDGTPHRPYAVLSTLLIKPDPAFYYYHGTGVYYGSNCPGGLDDLDHQVTVVGYGTQDGHDYWIVKNSYSHFWYDDNNLPYCHFLLFLKSNC